MPPIYADSPTSREQMSPSGDRIALSPNGDRIGMSLYSYELPMSLIRGTVAWLRAAGAGPA